MHRIQVVESSMGIKTHTNAITDDRCTLQGFIKGSPCVTAGQTEIEGQD
jgi:hypothetical protein